MSDPIHPASGDLEAACQLPPPGWSCSRTPGHEGPCAARFGSAGDLAKSISCLNEFHRDDCRYNHHSARVRDEGCSCGLTAAIRNALRPSAVGAGEAVAWLTTGGDVTRSRAYAIEQSVNDPENYPVALYPANPPATAAGVGEAYVTVPRRLLKDGIAASENHAKFPEVASRMKQALMHPASHDALIARVREVLEYYGGDHEYPNDGPWGINSDDFGQKARALLTDLDARDGG